MTDATLEEAAVPALGPYREDAPRASTSRALPRALRPRELLALLGIIVVADVACFSGNRFAGGGFGLALIFGLSPLAMLAGAALFRRSRGVLLVGALLALVTLRSAIDPTTLTTLMGLLLLFVLAVGLRFRQPSSIEVLGSGLQTVIALPIRVVAAGSGVRSLLDRTALRRGSVAQWGIPLLLCALFLPVLAFANTTLASALSSVWELAFQLGWPSASRILWWSIAFFLGLALVRPSLMPNSLSDAAPVSSVFDDQQRRVAHNSLIALNALFVAFIVLDVAVLVTGHAPAQQSTRDYAHQGAFWLTVALGMLTMVIGVMFRGPLAHDPSAARTRALAFVWIAQGLAMALCTYGRIAIHVHDSGLSNLRIVGILGTTLVVVGMLMVGHKLRAGRSFAWLVRRQFDAFVVVLTLYAVLPTHYLGARFNVARALHGAHAPLRHMSSQARETEAVTQLLPLLQHPDPEVRQGVANLLRVRLDDLRGDARRRGGFQQHDVLLPAVLATLSRAEAEIRAELPEDPQAGLRLLSWSDYGDALEYQNRRGD